MNYWLLKSEPNVWAIDQQIKSGKKGAIWDGVRNYQAANNLKKMKNGDLCFFYHSNQNTPSIVGIMEVCSEAYPDALQFDPTSIYFDEKSTEKLSKPITRDQLKAEERLEAMELFRLGRYSITRVQAEEWEHILTLNNAQ